ncbi:MAG: gliding motility-associated C-terminal domain-containing protein [Chitinophagales bacterium]
MRSCTSFLQTLFLMLSAVVAVAQSPAAIGTDVTGTYVQASLTQYGLFGQYRVQAPASFPASSQKVEFPIAVGNFSTVWRAYTAGQTLAGFNQMIDPATQPASARYNSGFGGQGILLPAITAGRWYTFNVMTNQGNNNDTMAVLETAFDPTSIDSVTIPIDTNTINPLCSPEVRAYLGAAPQPGEYFYVRFSTSGFKNTSTVVPMTVVGNVASCNLPPQAVGVNVQYYVLSTTEASMITTGPGSGYYDCLTLRLKTGSVGNNFRYTVKNIPTPSVSITASSNPVCDAARDTFVAMAVDQGTLRPNFQWYKNGNPVGTDDSVYIDAALVSGDSVWVAMQANLGCPVTVLSNKIFIAVNPYPTGVAFADPVNYCLGGTTNLFIEPAIPATVNWYTTPTGGIALSNSSSFNYTPATAGRHDYYAELTSVDGCVNPVRSATFDSVLAPSVFNQAKTICAGDSVVVGKSVYRAAGTYADTLAEAAVNACDSVVNTTVTVLPVATFSQSPAICLGSSFAVGSKLYNTAGTYVDTLTAAGVNGCDSIVTTVLTIKMPSVKNQHITICNNQSYTVGSKVHVLPGLYSDTLTGAAVNGCDSIVNTDLQVNPVIVTNQSATICSNQQLVVGVHAYNATGLYSDTLTGAAVNGCDSIVNTDLQVNPVATSSQNLTLCNNDSVVVGVHTYNTAGTYSDTLVQAAVNGCDSVITTVLNVLQVANFSQTLSICNGDSVVVGTHVYNAAGTYADTLLSAAANGCDSIVNTQLSILSASVKNQSPTICSNQSITVGSHVYAAPGFYSDTLKGAAANGCDSIVNTDLTVLPVATFSQSVSICSNQSYSIGTHTYNTPGSYVDTLVAAAANGCDSIVTTNLDIAPAATFSQQPSICAGDSFVVGSKVYYTAQVYVDTLANAAANGCDSIVTTTLSVLPWANSTAAVQICAGDSVISGGHVYYTAGTYTDTLKNAAANGCDSVVQLTLTVLPVATFSQTVNLCPDQFVQVGSHTYSLNGVYEDTLKNAAANGCDSIITTTVVQQPKPVITLGQNISQCGGKVVLDAGNAGSTYLWSNLITTQLDTASTSGLYSVVVTTTYGCIDSAQVLVYIKPVPVVNLGQNQFSCSGAVTLDAGNPGMKFQWNTGDSTQTISAASSNIYSVTVTNINSLCTASSSVQVMVSQPIAFSLGNDTAICGTSYTLSAPASANAYQWSNGATTPSITVTATGTYGVTVSTEDGCTSSDETIITLNPNPDLGADVTDSICAGVTVNLYRFFQGSGLTIQPQTPNPAAVGVGTYTILGIGTGGCRDTAVVNLVPRIGVQLGNDVIDSLCFGNVADLTGYLPQLPGYASYVWNTASPQAASAGTYQLAVADAAGCRDTAQVSLVTAVRPVLGADVTDSICVGSTFDLTNRVPNQGYTVYQWNTATPTAAVAGVYQLVAAFGNGCKDTLQLTLVNRVKPVVSLAAIADVCITAPQFSLQGGLPVGGTYWINNLVDSIVRPSVLGAGPYRVVYSYTNASGCTDSAVQIGVVRPQPVLSTLAIPAVCGNSPAVDLTPYFSPAGGVFSGLGVSGIYYYPSLGNTRADTITYIYTSSFGCADTVVNTVSTQPAVQVSLRVSDADFTICAGDTVVFTASGAVQYVFVVNGVQQGQPSTNGTFVTTLQHHDAVSVIGYNSCSSDTSEDIILDVRQKPVVSAGRDTLVDEGQTVVLQGSASGDGLLLYNWTPGFLLNQPNVPRPAYEAVDSVRFFLHVSDAYGCTDSDDVVVRVLQTDEVEFPNVITPNNDGKNDVWIVADKLDLAGSHLLIFNRWGQWVYETDNYANNWGGTYRDTGKLLPDDTYYFVLTLKNGNKKLYKGAINIVNSAQ